MHDIWNPWHGCVKVSEGCQNCYMYYLDRVNGRDGSRIYRTGAGFKYPLRKDRRGEYIVKAGETIRVCMTSDFFLEEADAWRREAWDVMRERGDVAFFLLTKRIGWVRACLPEDWGAGWENVFLNVSAENQARAEERVPALLDIPAKHRGVMCAPLIGRVELGRCLASGKLEQVIAGGENYGGRRICDFEWIKELRAECESAGVKFCFIETGSRFVKDGRTYELRGKRLQSEMAWKSGMSYEGRPLRFMLRASSGEPLSSALSYVPHFRESCDRCGSRPICNGCSDCGKCA
jgi:protein gp37